MSDERPDDEAPPEIPDLAKEPGADRTRTGAKAEPRRDSDLDIEIEVEKPSDPGEVIDAVEVVSTPVPAPARRMRERLTTNPPTPVARASVPPAPVQALPEAESPLPRPLSQPPPPRPVLQPPPARSTSQPLRPVSQLPRPLSQPPPAPAAPKARLDSEPPTEPYNPAPEPPTHEPAHEDPSPASAATSYPPPPVTAEKEEARHEEQVPPVSVKPMPVIRVSAPRPNPTASATGPVSSERPVAAVARPEPAAVVPPARPARAKPPVVPEELDEASVAPASSDANDSEIYFPVDEGDEAALADQAEEDAGLPVGHELTDDDINSPMPPSTEITVDVDESIGPDATPPRPIAMEAVAAKPCAPPPPRREVKPVTPPSAVDIKEAKEAQRAKQRKAWWEEFFGEDFGRANARLKPAQIVQEANFIEESLGVAKGGLVLDLACGAGHHAVELARRGYGVVGYDLSLYQLAVAADVAQDAGQKLNLLQGDMREMAFEEMFDGIYCWNTSFGYFEEEKNAAVAQRIFRALRPGGMFLVDVANRDFVVDHQPSQTWFEGDGSVCMDDMSIDFITSRLRVKRSLIIDDGRTLECVCSIRLYSLHELGKVLHEVGFRVTEASGHPATPGVFFGASSPRIIILAQRP